MVVEVVEFAPGKALTALAADLRAQGGDLVVMSWRPGQPTTASITLPDDDSRRTACRCLIDLSRAMGAGRVTSPGSFPA